MRSFVVLAVLLLGGALSAAQGLSDPFAQENELKRSAPPAPAPTKAPPTAKVIDFKVSAEPSAARRGETMKLTITGTPKPGYHTYPLTQRANNPNQTDGLMSRLTFEDSSGLKPLWPVAETPPEAVKDKAFGTVLEHTKPFTWTQDVLILPDAEPGAKTLRFRVKVQVCDENRCLIGEHVFELPLTVKDEPAVALSPELKARLDEKRPEPKVVAVSEASGTPLDTKKPERGAETQKAETGFWAVLLAAMGAALAMLFTPCVFPMIPITVSFFLKQSEKKHHNAPLMAAVYSGTIIVVLSLAVLVLGRLIVEWANSWWMNLGLGVVLVVFALSLFGMYEIELPNALARFTSAREGRGGYGGAFFMALTFTITSFTCTGPFLGLLLAPANQLKLTTAELAAASVAYAATFAAPFFVLALFPTLLKKLPRSGGWLNGVKVVAGFLELAAALKFLSNTDATLFPGDPRLFNYDTVLIAWIVLSAACGLYLFGAFRLPHDTPLDHLGVPRMILATLFFGLALSMAPALFRKPVPGVVGEKLVALLPLDTARERWEGASSVGTAEAPSAHLTWHRDYAKAWEEAVRDGKILFIDFTGVNCPNCRENEGKVFPRQDVRAELAKFVRVQLYTDTVPDPGLSSDEAERRGKVNADWRSATFGEEANPFYVLLRPSKDAPDEDGKLKGTEVGRYGGTITNLEEFLTVLRDAQSKQVARR